MSETGHDLHALFPAQREILHDLKVENGHFRQLADRYHGIVQEIAGIESGMDAASDGRLEELKKTRLAVLDEIAEMISGKVVVDFKSRP